MVSQKGNINAEESEVLADIERRAELCGVAADRAFYHKVRNLVVGLQTRAQDNWGLYQESLGNGDY
jgi:hypothetical protein